MPELSILIPARNEIFLAKTIENILENIEGDTEIIAVLDGYRPDPLIEPHPRLTLIYHEGSIGQRAATNEAARASRAKYIMKCDAHCCFDEGFDIKLMSDCEPDQTVIPRMYNLHAFDWKCPVCKFHWMQGPKPEKCECGNTDLKMEIVWQPKWRKRTDFARFDRELHFQYWSKYKNRPEANGDIADVMCSVGACWFMERKRFWELEGLDEQHTSWGQMGVEIACKSWLSGGRQVVNKNTWFSHLFRTQKGFNFPYALYDSEIVKARARSRWLWMKGNWGKAKLPLRWLVDKFNPVPDWEDFEWTMT